MSEEIDVPAIRVKWATLIEKMHKLPVPGLGYNDCRVDAYLPLIPSVNPGDWPLQALEQTFDHLSKATTLAEFHAHFSPSVVPALMSLLKDHQYEAAYAIVGLGVLMNLLAQAEAPGTFDREVEPTSTPTEAPGTPQEKENG